MKKNIVFICLIFGYGFCVSQNMPSDIGAPYTLPAGNLQVELSYNYGDYSYPSTKENSYQTLLRYGMAPNFEIMATYNQKRLSSNETHISDGGPISVGTNLFLISGQKWWPAIGLITAVNIPLEDSGKVSSTIGLNLDRQLNSVFNIGANLQADFGENLSNAYSVFPYIESTVFGWSTVYVAFDYGHEGDESSTGINIGTWLWVIEDATFRFSFTRHFNLMEQTAIPENILDFGLVYRVD